MQRYEYRVVPAPRRSEKARGLKTTQERFGLALTNLMNRMGAEGWEYQRADTLPCDERVGLMGRTTSFQNMLVFRRDLPNVDARVAQQPANVDGSIAFQGAEAPAFPRSPADAPQGPAPRLGPPEPPAGPAPALGPAAAHSGAYDYEKPNSGIAVG